MIRLIMSPKGMRRRSSGEIGEIQAMKGILCYSRRFGCGGMGEAPDVVAILYGHR